MADQNAAVTRAFDVTATTQHLLGITPPAGAWRRGGIDGINCTTRDVTRHQTVAIRGSWHIAISLTSNQKLRRVWNSSKKVGYKVIRVEFDDKGLVNKYTDFMTGFLKNEKVFGRPAAPLELRDGSMLISDDHANLIYRITYITR